MGGGGVETSYLGPGANATYLAPNNTTYILYQGPEARGQGPGAWLGNEGWGQGSEARGQTPWGGFLSTEGQRPGTWGQGPGASGQWFRFIRAGASNQGPGARGQG